MKKSNLLLLFLIFAFSTVAQENTNPKEKISSSIRDYFFLERENIHLHLDKNIFLTNEEIWFKGYVFHRKNNTPFLITSNVFAVLMDADGNKAGEKLLFANNGTFSGSFKLDDSYTSGNYTLQFYTNWMNNFTEDESSIYKIKIINQLKPSLASNKPDYSRINIDFNPEGGSFIQDVDNVVGIKVSGCNGKPLIIPNGEIIDSKGQKIKDIILNKFGFGKFTITPSSEIYKAVFTINGMKTETLLPQAVKKGISVEVNNFAIPNKTIVKVKTNAFYTNELKSKPLLLIVQKDDKATVFEVSFSNGKTEQELIFLNENTYDGLNTLRIIDAENNEIAQRIIFKYPEYNSNLHIGLPEKADYNSVISGKIAYANANLSIAVLPENTDAVSNDNDIFGSFLINPYITETITNAKYYLNNPSKAKHYELDLFLLNQKSKYEWHDIVTNPPKATHDFDFGINIKGTLNQAPKDSRYKIKLYSFKSQINEIAELNEKNEFYFRNLVVADSSWVNLSLVKMPDLNTPLTAKMFIQVQNGKRVFNKLFKPKASVCSEPEYVDLEMPGFQKNMIYLENVDVNSKFKLKRQMQFGNSNLRGYKIIAENNGRDVINFIQENGFDAYTERGDVYIFGRSRTTINGQRSTPVVYIDNFRILTFEELWGMRMDEIDEIYINAQAIVPSVTNNIGIIKIYRKKPNLFEVDDSKVKSVPFLIENAFKKIMPFKNAEYISHSGKGFDNFGLVHWIPTVISNENGDFKFQIPSTQQENVKLLIEGFTPDGKLISETMTIKLN